MHLTLEEIKDSEKDFLTVEEISGFLHHNPQHVRHQIKVDKDSLGFPIIIVNHRIKIPRQAFIRFIEGTEWR